MSEPTSEYITGVIEQLWIERDAERALADDQHEVLRQLVDHGSVSQADVDRVMANWQEMRGPVAIDDANVREHARERTMSPEALEFIIVVLAGLLIIMAVWEVTRFFIKRIDQREQERQDHQTQRWLREEVDELDN